MKLVSIIKIVRLLLLFGIICPIYVYANESQITFSGTIVQNTNTELVQTYLENETVHRHQIRKNSNTQTQSTLTNHIDLPQQVESIIPQIVKAKNNQSTHVTYTIQYY